VLYTDFDKAFDKVPRNRLMSILGSCGIGEALVKWAKAFLQHRKHMVRVNLEYSDFMPVISGILQGSVLAPLLFIICIIDLPEYIGDNVECDLFADDAKLTKHVRGTADAGIDYLTGLGKANRLL